MKVFISGGAGYIGSELTRSLSINAQIDEIIVYDNLSRENYNFFLGEKLGSTKVRFVQGDILDSRKLRKTLEGVDVVYHLAANVTTPFADQNPHFFEQVNHWGTAELVYAVEASDCKRFIFLSSTSVYGSGSNEVNVSSPLNPRTYYGISKMRAEDHVKRLMDKMDAYIIRSGNVFGYSKAIRIDAVVNKFMFDAQFKGRISIQGDGEQHRSFISMPLLVGALEKLAIGKQDTGIYNLVDKTLSINELSMVIKGLYPELEMIYVNQHLKMRDSRVERDESLFRDLPGSDLSLAEELSSFKKAFAF